MDVMLNVSIFLICIQSVPWPAARPGGNRLGDCEVNKGAS